MAQSTIHSPAAASRSASVTPASAAAPKRRSAKRCNRAFCCLRPRSRIPLPGDRSSPQHCAYLLVLSNRWQRHVHSVPARQATGQGPGQPQLPLGGQPLPQLPHPLRQRPAGTLCSTSATHVSRQVRPRQVIPPHGHQIKHLAAQRKLRGTVLLRPRHQPGERQRRVPPAIAVTVQGDSECRRACSATGIPGSGVICARSGRLSNPLGSSRKASREHTAALATPATCDSPPSAENPPRRGTPAPPAPAPRWRSPPAPPSAGAVQPTPAGAAT